MLFKKLHEMGIDTCIISNNKEPRVAPFANLVGSEYIFKAGKPKKTNYIKAMEIMGTDISNTYFIGDQIFTDIYGANRTGIPSILVKPINKKKKYRLF